MSLKLDENTEVKVRIIFIYQHTMYKECLKHENKSVVLLPVFANTILRKT